MFKISVPKILRTRLAVLLMFVFALGASMQEAMASGAYAPLEEAVSRAIQGHGHPAPGLTDVSGGLAFINILLFKIV